MIPGLIVLMRAPVGHHLGRGLCVIDSHVSEHYVLGDTDSSRDCLADLASPDDDDHVPHNLLHYQLMKQQLRRGTRPGAPSCSRAVFMVG